MSIKIKKKGTNIVSYLILVLALSFVLIPILWALITSLKPEETILQYPPSFLPKKITLKNYTDILFKTTAPRAFLNSFILAIGGVVVTLFVALHAAYAASRFKSRLSNGVLFFILSMSFLPGITILVPLYLLSHKLGMHNTYFYLILVYCSFQVPQVTWFIRGFIDNVSPAMEEAALIDGCSKWGALYRIVLPNILGGMLASALIVFIFIWNDFIIASVLTISRDMRNVQMSLSLYHEDIGIFWGKFMAFNILSVLPPALIYMILHERFVKGLAVTTEK